MPIYDYVCSACGQRTEVVHGIHGHGPLACPQCGTEGMMKKAFVPPVIHFKGSGWAKKDRSATASPGRSGTSKGSSSKAPDSGSKAETTPSAGSTSDGSSSASTGPSPAGAAAD